MITLTNYQSQIKPALLTTPALKQGHDFMIDFADLYGEDADISQAIDNHLKAVNDLMEQSESKIEKIVKASPNIHIVKPTSNKPSVPVKDERKSELKDGVHVRSGKYNGVEIGLVHRKTPQGKVFYQFLVDGRVRKQGTYEEMTAKFEDHKNLLQENNTSGSTAKKKVASGKKKTKLSPVQKERMKTKFTTAADNAKKKVAGSRKPKKAKVKKEPAIRKKELIRTFDEEVNIIKRFFRLVRKDMEVRSFTLLHRFIQKLLADKKVHGNSKFADLVTTIANKTADVVEKAKGITSDKVHIQVADNFYSQVENIAKKQAVYPSVRLFKRFIGMQGEVPSQKKLTGLIDAIEKAFAAKRIVGTDPFADELKTALETLKEAKKQGSIKPMQIGLSGAGGLGEVAAYLGMPFADFDSWAEMDHNTYENEKYPGYQISDNDSEYYERKDRSKDFTVYKNDVPQIAVATFEKAADWVKSNAKKKATSRPRVFGNIVVVPKKKK